MQMEMYSNIHIILVHLLNMSRVNGWVRKHIVFMVGNIAEKVLGLSKWV